MIDKKIVDETVADAIAGTDLFVVDTRLEPGDRIVVEIDSRSGALDIDTCAAISRRIEQALDRDTDDFELEVGSAGLTSPFKVKEQYVKNIGNQVEVLTADGRKLRGTLTEVSDDAFTVVTSVKEKPEGAKRPVTVDRPVSIPYADARRVSYLIDFK